MGGNPNLWNNMHDAAYVVGSSIPFNSLIPQNSHQPPPPTWSQLLFSGAPGEEQRLSYDHFQAKKLGTWEEQVLNNPSFSRVHLVEELIKQEACLYGHGGGGDEEFQGPSSSAANWAHMVVPAVSSPPRSSCITSFTSSHNINNDYDDDDIVLDSFSYNKAPHTKKTHLPPAADPSSEYRSTATGGICKKARVQASSSQTPLKVRKEKLGDRISALHQLVSPFGKTDTASVLLEASGYIRFLHGQIEALCFPYFGNSSKSLRNHCFVNHGERNSVFPEDPGQLLNSDSSLKRNGAPKQENGEEKAKGLRSKGLCLVPMSLSHRFGSDHNSIGAEYWSSTYATCF